MADPRAHFSVMGPDLPTNEFSVGAATYAIGRVPTNDLPLNHQKVSRHHADITFNGNFFAIEDLESSNGTYVNETRLEAKKPLPLQPGDVIRIGPFTLTLTKIDQAEAERAPTPAPAHAEQPPAVSAVATPAAPTPDQAPAAVQPEVYVSTPPPLPHEASTAQPQPTMPPVRSHDEDLKTPVSNGKVNGHALAMDDGEVEVIRPARPISVNGHHRTLPPYVHIEGIPLTESRYMQYLPGVYSDSDFLKRFLLIMESILAPLEWGIDSFEQFYNPLVTTPDWLQWIGEWFDILIHPTVPLERQRAVVKELGILYLQRGTRKGLTRLLELYFGVLPNITEHDTPPSSFTVQLALGKEDTPLARSLAEKLITVCKPAHTGFTLEVT